MFLNCRGTNSLYQHMPSLERKKKKKKEHLPQHKVCALRFFKRLSIKKVHNSTEKTKIHTSPHPTAPGTAVPWWNMTHFWLSALSKAAGVSKPFTGGTSIMALKDFSLALALFHSGPRRMDTVHHHSTFNGAFKQSLISSDTAQHFSRD